MFNSKYSNILTVLLVIAIIAIVILIGYFGYDIYRKYYKNKTESNAVDEYNENLTNKIPIKDNSTNNENGVNIAPIETLPDNNEINNNTNSVGPTTVKQKTPEGFVIVGTIEISKINLKYRVLEKPSTKALDTAVCLMYGELNRIGNTVVIGHNYRNGTFFSNLYKLSNGDKITITDYTGKKVTYTVYSIFEAEPEDTSFYERSTNGAREITLSTCTDDSSKRTIVLAKEN